MRMTYIKRSAQLFQVAVNQAEIETRKDNFSAVYSKYPLDSLSYHSSVLVKLVAQLWSLDYSSAVDSGLCENVQQ